MKMKSSILWTLALLFQDAVAYSSRPVLFDGLHQFRHIEPRNILKMVGLNESEVLLRQTVYGRNELAAAPRRSIWSLTKEQFENRLVQGLVGVAAISGALAFFEKDSSGGLSEPAITLAILLINAFVGIYHSRQAETSLDALTKLQPSTATVLREGIWRGNFSAVDLVPGDIISVKVGDRVPADARILELKSMSLQVDESTLTGESVTVQKDSTPIEFNASLNDKSNVLFSGTMVTKGTCVAVVTGTGANTEMGKINAGVQRAQTDRAKTPLTLQLDQFGDQMAKMVTFLCAGIFALGIPNFGSSAFSSRFAGTVHHAKSAIALGVAAIPEGLPVIITLCLSLATERMARKNVIVRKLPSVETLGCTSVICTDKTGTLTTNQMVVRELITFSGKLGLVSPSVTLSRRTISGVSYDPRGEVSNFSYSQMLTHSGWRNLAAGCSLCNEAKLELKDGRIERIGEPTEAALRVLVEKLGSGHDPLTTRNDSKYFRHCSDFWFEEYNRLAVLEFDRERKSMSVLCRHKKDKFNRLFVKGAAEVILDRCDRIQLEDGRIVTIGAETRENIAKEVQRMARDPMRCLAVAYSDGNALKGLQKVTTTTEATSFLDNKNFIEFERQMVLTGICGIKDPARPEAAEAIDKCRTAGIRVMMITGDSLDTAVAIAKEVRILPAKITEADLERSAFTTQSFLARSEAEQLELLRCGNKVFCRAEPKDKQILISMLSKLGETTAMTGDGVNDAPALRQADIGIAMGITGTEVAKSAADMILTDDNFATIITAVEEGRNLYANIQSFVGFLISSNFGEIITILLSSLLRLPDPLSPLHLLWVNLVTDGPPATALGFNPGCPGVMKRPPRSRNEMIMNKANLIRFLVVGVYVGLASLAAMAWWYRDQGVSFIQLAHWKNCNVAEAATSSSGICNVLMNHRSIPQTMVLSVLVTIEMIKAVCAVSNSRSLLQVHPWQNPYLLLAVLASFGLHLGAMYLPAAARLLGLAPLTWRQWKVVLSLSSPIFVIEEALKWYHRNGDSVRSDSVA